MQENDQLFSKTNRNLCGFLKGLITAAVYTTFMNKADYADYGWGFSTRTLPACLVSGMFF